jgi:hypothetical protein
MIRRSVSTRSALLRERQKAGTLALKSVNHTAIGNSGSTIGYGLTGADVWKSSVQHHSTGGRSMIPGGSGSRTTVWLNGSSVDLLGGLAT